MVTQASINLMAEYIQSFINGTRKHNQLEWHSECGTTHCFAGWVQLDDAVTAGINPTWVQDHDRAFKSPEIEKWMDDNGFDSIEDYFKTRFGLQYIVDIHGKFLQSDLTTADLAHNLKTLAYKHNLSCPTFLWPEAVSKS